MICITYIMLLGLSDQSEWHGKHLELIADKKYVQNVVQKTVGKGLLRRSWER